VAGVAEVNKNRNAKRAKRLRQLGSDQPQAEQTNNKQTNNKQRLINKNDAQCVFIISDDRVVLGSRMKASLQSGFLPSPCRP
jgi:hypothetical protein